MTATTPLAERPAPPPPASPTPARRRRPGPSHTERALHAAGVGALALHLLDTSLRGAATTAWGLATIVTLAAAALVVQPRMRRRTRVAWSAALGLVVAGMLGVSDGLRFVTAGPAWGEATGVLAALGGLALVAAAGVALRGPRETPRPHRILRGAGWAGGAFAVLWLLIFPVGVALMTTHAPRLPVSDAALGIPHETVRIPMRGGGEVAAWYVPSRNGAAVVLIHGSSGNRSRVADRARMLARHGYGVLAMDLPGNGESDGRASGVGWTAQPGIEAALGFLARRPDVDPRRIAGFGVSLGGEVLLEATARDRRLRAIVSDGAARSTVGSDRNAPDGTAGAISRIVMPPTLRLIQATTGTRPAPPLERVIGRIGPRPALLVASGTSAEADANAVYRAAIGRTASLWRIPEAGHTGGLRVRPAEYERRTVGFLDRALRVG